MQADGDREDRGERGHRVPSPGVRAGPRPSLRLPEWRSVVRGVRIRRPSDRRAGTPMLRYHRSARGESPSQMPAPGTESWPRPLRGARLFGEHRPTVGPGWTAEDGAVPYSMCAPFLFTGGVARVTNTAPIYTEALRYHAAGRPGKLEIRVTKPCASQHDLSLAYSPGSPRWPPWPRSRAGGCAA